MKSAVVTVLAMALALPVVQAANPIQKVLEMLSGLQQKLITEGNSAQSVYDERSKFCEESAQNFGFEIKDGRAQVGKLKATIESDTASATALSAKIEDLSSDISSNEADLKAAVAIRTKEAADFTANEGELTQVVDSLERAISVLTKEMAGASMLQLKSASSVTEALRSWCKVRLFRPTMDPSSQHWCSRAPKHRMRILILSWGLQLPPSQRIRVGASSACLKVS